MADEQSIPTERVCTKCAVLKPLKEFNKAARGKYGHSARCRDCDKAYAQQSSARINEMSLARYHRKQQPKRLEKLKALQFSLDRTDKRCCTCQETKPKSEFAKSKSAFDGLRRRRKACSNAANKKYREENPETSAASSSNWARRNPDKTRAKAKRHYDKCPEKGRAMAARWRSSNPEAAKLSSTKASRKRRKRADIRIHDAIGSQIRSALRQGKCGVSSFDALGYSLDDLMRHLERQMLRGMTWDNYGEWHIDHITPLSSFYIDSIDSEEVRAAWALSNLRPLWKFDNLSKSDKIIFLI